jgi:formate hydrogenlyase subunit 6/NADH:ubiquinone oxidoreductase subunit I
MTDTSETAERLLPKARLDELINVLREDGYEIIGPRLAEGAIIYGPLQQARDLPIGWTDRQAPGSYRLERRSDGAYFGYAVGPHSWKRYLFPPTLTLWRARRSERGFEVQEVEEPPRRRALLGVRACELHAIAVQDRVFLNRADSYTDPHYAAAREQLLLIAVECEHAGETCFCSSMKTGPEVRVERFALPLVEQNAHAEPAVDLVLTELEHAFVVRAGSEKGRHLLDRLVLARARLDEVAEARQRVAHAAKQQRQLDTTQIRELLHRNQEHPRWDDVAQRCLACTNCTLVCPTCFCSSVEDVTDLAVEQTERVRRWDSCFNPEFAQVHGGNFRPSIQGRYRQWLTHKFASWYDQFGVSGCVGCGRCITWCPVGIDVTEEINAIRTMDGQRKEQSP